MQWPWNKEPKKQETQTSIPSNSLFSTDFTVRAKLTPMQEHRARMALLSKTFQQGSESLVAQDTAGNVIDHAMDTADGQMTTVKMINSNSGLIPLPQLEYFAQQGFIGWQMCAVLAQNWVIDKACRMPAEDAIRHGWDLSSVDGEEIDEKTLQRIKRLDKKYMIKRQCRELVKNGRIFGVRHALYVVDGIDYSAPFNPDGVRPGSYRGVSQIDPYWLAPVLDQSAAADPTARDFYEPTWWQCGNRRIHRSHLCIMRNGDQVSDLLKPSYIYGGIPLPQKIFERVYAAEKTANEAPMLAMTKRLTSLKIDLTAAAAQQDQVREKMEWWVNLRDNYGVKIIGTGDELEQFDTALSDLDNVIWQQFELVSAAAEMPATKLLGKTPGGMNATGQYDEKSYHESLESIQEHDLTPFLDGHYVRMIRSDIAPRGKVFAIEVAWKPTDSPTAQELADINLKKAQTGSALAANGAIDGFDERQRIANDPDSGYNGIPEIVPEGPGDREYEQEVAAENRDLEKQSIAAEVTGRTALAQKRGSDGESM